MPRRRAAHGERGQMLPLVAFALVCLFGVAALAIDLGYWRYEQRMQQAAADSAAVAGANEVPHPADSPTANPQCSPSPSPSAAATAGPVTIFARSDAASNGYTDGCKGVNVTVNNPPVSGPYTGDPNSVEVIVRKTQPAFFAGIFGKRGQSVGARAVAKRPSGGGNCMYALQQNGQGFTINGGHLLAPQCGVASNSGMSNNNAEINATNIGYSAGNGCNNCNSGTYDNARPLPAANVSNPCTSLAGCTYMKNYVPAGNPTCYPTTTFQNNGPVTLTPQPPGYLITFCQNVMFNNGGKVTFGPGQYDFQNGMTVNNASELDSTGATFYNENGSFIINCCPVLNLAAPTSGNTAGVLFYQRDSDTSQFTVNSGSQSAPGTFAGMVYVGNSTQFISDGLPSSWSQIVAGSILLNLNGATLNVNSPTSGSGSGPVLVQ